MKKEFVILGTLMVLIFGFQVFFAVVEILNNNSYLGWSSVVSGLFSACVGVKLINEI